MWHRITIISLLLFILVLECSAQVEYLRLSPAQNIIQRVGATDVTISFSRPQMNGRKIFGSLVPFGKMWRTGANENTTVSFDHRVRIGETVVSEGKYTLLAMPEADYWGIYFYTETNNLDVPNPIDSSKLIFLTDVKTRALDRAVQTLVINLYDITETTANLGISWENTEVMIPISFYTREAMEKQIEKEFKQNIFDYSITASYYSQRGVELEKAKRLQELVMQLKDQPNSWDYNSYGIILQKLGFKKEAMENIKHSLKLARESDNKYLIGENEKLLKVWSK